MKECTSAVEESAQGVRGMVAFYFNCAEAADLRGCRPLLAIDITYGNGS